MKISSHLRLLTEKSAQDLFQLENFVWLLNRMPASANPRLSHSVKPEMVDDTSLVERVMRAYQSATAEFQASSSGWDNELFTIKKDIHDALLGEKTQDATRILRDPASHTFFWGFDAIASSPNGELEPHELVLRRLNKSTDWVRLYALWVRDALISFAEVIGARRVAYPEIDLRQSPPAESSIDFIIDEIETELGFPLNFPNPYPGEIGLESKRGIIGFRSVQSLYQAWRIAQIASGNVDFKVMEIGAGLGRTAYFANLFGIKNYTIVDIPLTNAAQGYFLGRVLGSGKIQLHGEDGGAEVRIIPPTAISDAETYDLIVNVDSWTEMSPDVAMFYWNYARKTSKMVLSINHEFNPHTVRTLYKDDKAVKALRYPYCMRRGYMEELLTWE